MNHVRLAAAAAAVVLLAACSGPSTERSASAVPPRAPAVLQRYDIVLNSDPHSKTGSSTINVTVKSPDGTSVSDADVTADFVMPVMPSMGKSTTTLVSQGNGHYEGAGTLSMAGSWQVTVVAKRGNEILASKTFNLVAKE